MVAHSEHMCRIVAAELPLDKRGLEISPYFDPMLKKTDHDVCYTDYTDTESLRKKAAQNPSLAGAEIPAVDFVWTPGASLLECAGGRRFDYALASHVMEHVPDPIGWINQVFSVLNVGGKLALFLPERRFNSDYFRNVTGFESLVASWIAQPKVPTPTQIVDFMAHSFANFHGTVTNWEEEGGPKNVERAYGDAEAVETGIFVHNEGEYIDVHCTVWEATKFRSTFERIIKVGLLNAEIGRVVEEGAEFLVVLTKLGEPSKSPPVSRDEKWNAMEADLQHYRQAYASATTVQRELLERTEELAVSRDEKWNAMEAELQHYRQAYVSATTVQREFLDRIVELEGRLAAIGEGAGIGRSPGVPANAGAQGPDDVAIPPQSHLSRE